MEIPYIFEDVKHYNMWDTIIKYIRGWNGRDSLPDATDLKEMAFSEGYKRKGTRRVVCNQCFACDYALRVALTRKRNEYECIFCPFIISTGCSCLNGTYLAFLDAYEVLLGASSFADGYVRMKHTEAIDLATRIRDWKVRDGVLRRSTLLTQF